MTTATEMSPKAIIEAAITFLARVCDGASSEDGHGFSKFDSMTGHRMARDIADGRPIDHVHALRIVGKYRRQLDAQGIALPPIEADAPATRARKCGREAGNATRERRDHPRR